MFCRHTGMLYLPSHRFISEYDAVVGAEQVVLTGCLQDITARHLITKIKIKVTAIAVLCAMHSGLMMTAYSHALTITVSIMLKVLPPRELVIYKSVTDFQLGGCSVFQQHSLKTTECSQKCITNDQ